MTEPTDTDIDALWVGQQLTVPQLVQRRVIARAALAKWGSPPAVAGEVVACGNCGGTGWMVRDPDIGTDQECFVCDGSGRYSESATLQHTQPQAGAVPLPSVELMRLVMDVEQRHNFLRGTTNWAVAVGRAIEAAHGIKGGQHG